MAFSAKNQAPGRIDRLAVPTPLTITAGEYQPEEAIEVLVKKDLLNPLSPTAPVQVSRTDSAGVVTGLSSSDIAHVVSAPIIAGPSGTSLDTPENNSAALEVVSELSDQTIDPSWPYVRHLFVAQSASELGLPAPGPRVIYTAADDVIPAARNLISKASSANYEQGALAWDALMVGIGAAFSPAVLGVGAMTETAFTAFAEAAVANVTALHAAGKVSDETLKKFKELASSGLGELTEGVILRKDGDPTDEYSFARLLHQQVVEHAKSVRTAAKASDSTPEFALLPFDLEQLICPLIVVFVNAEHHARAKAQAVTKEWNSIATTASAPIAMISTKTLTKVNAAAKRLSTHRSMVRAKERVRNTERRAPIGGDFREDAPPPKAAIVDIMKFLERMERVNHSQNVIRYRKKSYTRSSRRRPDDPNVPGRSVGNKFYPDIHIYADTSGSISEGDYRASIMLSAMLAKKLDVDLYFSSHSHVLSNEVKIPTKGRSIPAIMKMFAAVPKVTGGNRFEVVYNYIQASPVRRQRLNVITTDFGWAPNSLANFTHPKNLVYIPVWDRSSPYGWDGVKSQAVELITEMRRYDANIDHKVLGMGYNPPPIV